MLLNALSMLFIFHPDHISNAGDDPEAAAWNKALTFTWCVLLPLAIFFRFRLWEYLP